MCSLLYCRCPAGCWQLWPCIQVGTSAVQMFVQHAGAACSTCSTTVLHPIVSLRSSSSSEPALSRPNIFSPLVHYVCLPLALCVQFVLIPARTICGFVCRGRWHSSDFAIKIMSCTRAELARVLREAEVMMQVCLL
jgi:hypothetical protein